MADDKSRVRNTSERVLDAAERLLGRDAAAFSMRDLAAEAGTSFATPFNLFGAKAAIMRALSARRIEAMHGRLARVALPETAAGRVLAAVEVAVAVMLDTPAVNRAVMAAVGAPNDGPGDGPNDGPGGVAARSGALWAEALGAGTGLAASTRPLALAVLPGQLAVAFRGVLSFWTAGELPDERLEARAVAAAAAALLGFVGRDGRAGLLARIEAVAGLDGRGSDRASGMVALDPGRSPVR